MGGAVCAVGHIEDGVMSGAGRRTWVRRRGGSEWRRRRQSEPLRGSRRVRYNASRETRVRSGTPGLGAGNRSHAMCVTEAVGDAGQFSTRGGAMTTWDSSQSVACLTMDCVLSPQTFKHALLAAPAFSG